LLAPIYSQLLITALFVGHVVARVISGYVWIVGRSLVLVAVF
jgi:hypothetical protein